MDHYRRAIGQSTYSMWLPLIGTWPVFGLRISQDKSPSMIPHQRVISQPTSCRFVQSIDTAKALSRQALCPSYGLFCWDL